MPATSRYSAAVSGRMARCQFLGEAPVTGDVFLALSSTEIDDADLATEFVAGLTWTEYGGDYTRPQLDITDVLMGAVWKLRANPTDFGLPDAPTTGAAIAVVIYQGATADPAGDATARVVGWLQGPDIPFLPFTGDGATPLVVNWPSGGTVLTGPNC